jgi:hypothetical protein
MWLEDDAGERVDVVRHGDVLRLHALIEVRERVHDPVFDFWVDDDQNARILATSTEYWADSPPLEPGERAHLSVEAHNLLQNGRYHLGCSLLSGTAALDIAALVNQHKAFHVYGAEKVYGMIEFEHKLRVERERPR